MYFFFTFAEMSCTTAEAYKTLDSNKNLYDCVTNSDV